MLFNQEKFQHENSDTRIQLNMVKFRTKTKHNLSKVNHTNIYGFLKVSFTKILQRDAVYLLLLLFIYFKLVGAMNKLPATVRKTNNNVRI